MGYPMGPMPMQKPMMPVMEYPQMMPQVPQNPYMAMSEMGPLGTPQISMKVSPRKGQPGPEGFSKQPYMF